MNNRRRCDKHIIDKELGLGFVIDDIFGRTCVMCRIEKDMEDKKNKRENKQVEDKGRNR